MMLHSWRHGKIAPANPWHAKTLEWKVPTPVPLENFLVDPVVTSDPYTYGEGVPDGQEVPDFAPSEEPELVPVGAPAQTNRASPGGPADVDHHDGPRRATQATATTATATVRRSRAPRTRAASTRPPTSGTRRNGC